MSDGEDYADVDASAAGGGSATPRRDESLQSRAEPTPRDLRDEREHDDPFGPPKIACECYCLHCRRIFMSSEIWFQRIKNAQHGKLDGFWMCPTPNCDGKGFSFDIFPTDPAHPANEGWSGDDDDEDRDDDDDADWGEEEFERATSGPAGGDEHEPEYDPSESKWKQLDEEFGEEDDDDIEGEEWKYGLEPGEPLPEPEWVRSSRRAWEEEQKRYDEPDERPREIEWEYGEGISEDDIPF
ncbi:MAG: hypothetical protein QOF78_3363 [Phycisphaerales bacterium]|jgi:hypothetical protein|nr:hypothetical protein [Phycisphaerales bacterium]